MEGRAAHSPVAEDAGCPSIGVSAKNRRLPKGRRLFSLFAIKGEWLCVPCGETSVNLIQDGGTKCMAGRFFFYSANVRFMTNSIVL